jgi:hypothetical protein
MLVYCRKFYWTFNHSTKEQEQEEEEESKEKEIKDYFNRLFYDSTYDYTF